MHATVQRPTPVGRYEVITDFVIPTASVRVIRMEGPVGRIEQHIHHNTTQIYLGIEGEAWVTIDGVQHLLRAHETLAVHPGIAHGAAPAGGAAVVANISVPPLEFGDQLPVADEPEPPDLDLPGGDSDLED